MSTLRERTREALSANEPTEQEAQVALRAVLEHAQAKKAPRATGWLLVPVLAGAALVVYLVAFRPATPLARNPVTAETARATHRGVHMYLRSTNEPEAYALSIDIDSQGEH